MPLQRATRRLGSWFVALTVLVAALAPTAGSAWADPAAAERSHVCSALAVGSAGRAGATKLPRAGLGHDHCPWCALHAPALAPPPGLVVAIATAREASALPPSIAAPYEGKRWPGARPRAPPVAR